MNDIDIRRLDFTLLLVFRELLRTQRTTIAAQRLRLSQSAISHALTRLRAIFGDDLFLRRSNGLEPTEAAWALGAKVDAILALAEEALSGDGQFAPERSRRVFRLAANDYIVSLIAPALQARLAEKAPGVSLSFRFAVGATALDAVRRNDVDLALGRFASLSDDVESERLGAERYLVTARQDHPDIGGGLDLETYLRLEHVLVSFRGDFRGTADLALSRLDARRKVKLSVPMFLTGFALIQKSDLLLTAPARLSRAFAPTFGLALHEPPFEIEPFDVSAVSASRKRGETGLAWLIGQIRDVWTSLV
jgi:DNA-binding transcriptional LysR family regulator